MAEKPTRPITREVARDVAVQARKVSQSAEHLEDSAGAVRRSTAELTDSADRRTELAADRTILAAERTYAAWVRTALAALASGVAARAIAAPNLPEWIGQLTGTVLIAFAVFCLGAAVWRQSKPGAPPPRPDTAKLPSVLLILLNALLVLVCLAAMIAIWAPMSSPAGAG